MMGSYFMRLTLLLLRAAMCSGLVFATASLLTPTIGSALTISWADLTSDNSDAGTVSGSITAPSGTVGVTYSGGYAFDELNNTGFNYWTGVGYTYNGPANQPATSDIIGLSDANTGVITFSHAVQNVFVAFNSWNGAQVTFSAPFTIIGEGCGYWGCGTFVPNGTNTGFYGNGETVGILEFSGNLTSLTFTDTVPEYWHGLTVGIADVSTTPLPSTWTMMLIGLVGLGFFGCRQSKKGGLTAAA
jgi:hypothetical protein